MLPVFTAKAYKVRKVRLLGSAALALAYVAAGRLDAYLESCVRLWDIAAGGVILECAGGDFCRMPVGKKEPTYELVVNNGKLRSQLERFISTYADK
jgi:myo-inositol-1(or 4)-monophosphatase